jgi:DNA-binding CsgD family transcriptional regulator
VPGWSEDAEFALHPNLGFSILSQHRRRQLEQLTEQLHQDELQAELITQQYNDSMLRRDEREIEIVEGRARANQRLGQFRPEKSIWAFNPAERDAIPRATGDDSPDARYLKSGLDFRMICLVAAAAGKSNLGYLRWMTDLGGRIRATPSLPMKMLLFDGTALVLPLDPDEHTAGLIVHHGKAVVAMARAMFEHHWQHAADIFSPEPGSPDEITSQERELLYLLVQGATDDQAGRKLGLSLRTIRRMAAKLGEQAGASGRFELGVRAAQRGWVR